MAGVRGVSVGFSPEAVGVETQGRLPLLAVSGDGPDVAIFLSHDVLIPTRRARIDRTGRGFFNGGFQASGADFAESVDPLGDPKAYQPGDVVVIDPSQPRRVALATQPYSSLVAGIYSTRPGLLATPYDMDDPRLDQQIPMAMGDRPL